MTRRTMAVLFLLLALAPACGQKAGVALQSTGSGAVAGGGEELGGGLEEPAPDSGGELATEPGEQGGGEVAGPGAPAAPGGGGTPTTARPGSPPATTKPGPVDRTGVTDKEIVIGLHAPLTGAAPVPQDSFEAGSDVYWKFVKDKGGLLKGRNVRLVFRDDEFNPVRARQVCTEMVEKEKVFMLLGAAGADQITACAQYANSVGVPYLSAGVNTVGLSTLKTYFAISMTYAQQAPILATLTKNRLKKNAVAMLTMDTPDFADARSAERKAFAAAGVEIKADEVISKNASQSEAQAKAQQMKASGAEVVAILSSPTIFLNVAAAGQSQAYTPTYIGPGLTSGLNLVATAGCPAIGPAHFLSPFPQLDAIDSMDADFGPAYEKHTGDDPDDLGVALWGIAKAVRQYIDAAGPDLSRQGLIAAMETGKEFKSGVFPVSKFSSTNHLGGQSAHLLVADCAARQFKTAARFVTGF